MADDYYIPGMPQNLQGLLYTPNQDASTTKRLREQYAGNQGMQQKLAVDDRYHQGKDMIRDSPVAALASLLGSVPYDAAKLAYFNGPKPVKALLANATERMFPGEGFNDKTTSRPSPRQFGAQMAGMVEGGYGALRDGIQKVNEHKFSDSTVDRLRSFTTRMNNNAPIGGPFDDKVMGPDSIDTSSQEAARDSLKGWGGRQMVAHAMNPMGTGLKMLSNIIQTAVPDADTRQEFEPWMSPQMGMETIAPGYRGVKRMTPQRKAAHEAEISKLLESWPKAGGVPR